MKIEEMSDEKFLDRLEEMASVASGRHWGPEHKEVCREEILE